MKAILLLSFGNQKLISSEGKESFFFHIWDCFCIIKRCNEATNERFEMKRECKYHSFQKNGNRKWKKKHNATTTATIQHKGQTRDKTSIYDEFVSFVNIRYHHNDSFFLHCATKSFFGKRFSKYEYYKL